MIEEMQENAPTVEPTVENSQNEVETAPQNNQNDQKAEIDSIKEYNFRQMRMQSERDAQRAIIAEDRLKENERLSKERATESDTDLDSDDLMEKKHFKKQYSTLREENEKNKKETEKLKDEIQRYNSLSTELALKARYPNFSEVVTDENLERLSKQKPHLFRSIMANPSIMERGESAYEMINSSLNTKKYDSQDAKIAENKTKPRSVSTVVQNDQAATPLATFNEGGRRRLTPEYAAQLRKDMSDSARKRQKIPCVRSRFFFYGGSLTPVDFFFPVAYILVFSFGSTSFLCQVLCGCTEFANPFI